MSDERLSGGHQGATLCLVLSTAGSRDVLKVACPWKCTLSLFHDRQINLEEYGPCGFSCGGRLTHSGPAQPWSHNIIAAVGCMALFSVGDVRKLRPRLQLHGPPEHRCSCGANVGVGSCYKGDVGP